MNDFEGFLVGSFNRRPRLRPTYPHMRDVSEADDYLLLNLEESWEPYDLLNRL
jgi:hypothetical protein